jgi:hypothetical protein
MRVLFGIAVSLVGIAACALGAFLAVHGGDVAAEYRTMLALTIAALSFPGFGLAIIGLAIAAD